MATVNANEVALGIESFGDDDAPLVLLAGGTTMLSWPDALCERLADGGRRVVRYDLRDSGESTTADPEAPAYTLRDIMDAVARNKASSRWNVLNALEILETTKVFDIRGTPVKDLVAPGQCAIINLKGVSPDIQEIVVTRITNLLWEARKRGEIPAHILVVEEAHNFCPERNVGNAVSGAR